MKRLKILCLHGYNGTADVLRQQMQPLSSGLSELADFTYVTAPSRSVGDFGWWHAVGIGQNAQQGPGVFASGAIQYKGWNRTQDWMIGVFQQQGPFDGVFGFSQGAALTGLLVGMRTATGKTTSQSPLKFDFAMMVGGFPAVDQSLTSYYDARKSYDLPSVHIIGRSDTIVESDYSLDLARKFKNPLILEHQGGHTIAATPVIRDKVASFLKDRQT
jgi:predicted esterase